MKKIYKKLTAFDTIILRNGMEKAIIDICDEIVYIPISTIDSLNVAIAGSIMMYHYL